jgi:hypothetical protein
MEPKSPCVTMRHARFAINNTLIGFSETKENFAVYHGKRLSHGIQYAFA